MKPVSPELLALLATRQFFQVDLWTFVLQNSVLGTLRYCSGDQDLTVNGFLFAAGGQIGPYFDRKDAKAKIHQKVGTAVDQLLVDVLPGAATINGVPMAQVIQNGAFDGAEVTLESVYMPTYGDTTRGSIVKFVGRAAEVDVGRSIATFTINSHAELFNIQMPRTIYTPGCVNTLYDAACGVNPNDNHYFTTGAVLSGTTASVINATLATNLTATWPVGAFDQGKIQFTSGVLNGVSRSIRVCTFGTPNVVSLVGAFPVAPGAGDTFKIWFGCDRTAAISNVVFTGVMQNASSTIANVIYNGVASTTGIPSGQVVVGTGITAGTLIAGLAADSLALNATAHASATAPAGLALNTAYFWISIDSFTGYLATTLANANNGVFIVFANNGSGNMVVNPNASPVAFDFTTSTVTVSPNAGALATGTPVTLNAGALETFTISSANGCGKFANQGRYRGFRWIPQPTLTL